MKTRFLRIQFLATLVAAISIGVGANSQEASNTTPNSNLTASNPNLEKMLKEASKSPGIDEVVRMSAAGTDPSVIQSYVETSQTKFDLSADDVIQLHKSGIPPNVIKAMIQRGAELRQAASAAQAQQHAQPVAAAPTYIVQQPPAEQPASTVTYVGSGYPYYGYGYPVDRVAYYPSYSFSVGFGWPYYWYYPYYGYCGSYYYHGGYCGSYGYHGNYSHYNGSHNYNGGHYSGGGSGYSGGGRNYSGGSRGGYTPTMRSAPAVHSSAPTRASFSGGGAARPTMAMSGRGGGGGRGR